VSRGPMRALTRRKLLLWCMCAMISLPVAVFAGMGYFLLVHAVFHFVVTMANYSDRLGQALVGRQGYSTLAPIMERQRKSRVLKTLVTLTNASWFGLAILAVLKTNVKLVDLF
jgi:hypothetical protein